jgi:hypothetical protein
MRIQRPLRRRASPGVNKTGNLPVHPQTLFQNTLLRILEERQRQKLYPIHRLDRETSGLILLQRIPDSLEHTEEFPPCAQILCRYRTRTVRDASLLSMSHRF